MGAASDTKVAATACRAGIPLTNPTLVGAGRAADPAGEAGREDRLCISGGRSSTRWRTAAAEVCVAAAPARPAALTDGLPPLAVWRLEGRWEQILAVLRERKRVRLGREPTPSAAIVDSQSVKTTEKVSAANFVTHHG